MTRKLLAAALLLLLAFAGAGHAGGLKGGLPNANGAFSWSQSYQTTATGSCATTGTEGRQLLAVNSYTPSAFLLWATGNFGSPIAASGTEAFICILSAPENQGGVWGIDSTFAAQCAIEGQTPCFHTIDVMQSITFTKDASGNPVNAVIPVAAPIYSPPAGANVSNSCPAGDNPEYAMARNGADSTWYGTVVGCPFLNSSTAVSQIRSFSWTAHTDAVTGAQYAFAGGDPTGISNGQLNPSWNTAGVNPITWNLTPEWLTSSYYNGNTGPYACGNPRIMAIGELAGADGVSRAYMIICFVAYVRIDGPISTCGPQQVMVNGNCVARWQPYWLAQSVNTSSSSDLRGLTAIPNEGVLITGYEGSVSATSSLDEHLWSIPPLCPSSSGACSGHNSCGDYSATTGLVTLTNPTCGTSEISTDSTSPSLASISGQGVSNTVFPYNRLVPFYNSSEQLQWYMPFSNYVPGTGAPPNSAWSYMMNQAGRKWANATYLIRTSAGNYTLVAAPTIFKRPQNGARDIAVTPFWSECKYDPVTMIYYDCAIYVTGYDFDDGSPNQEYWCLPAGSPCPPSSYTLVNRGRTAVVARYGP